MVGFGSLLLCVYLLIEAGNTYSKEQSYISLGDWNRTTSLLLHGNHTCIFRDVSPVAAEEWQLTLSSLECRRVEPNLLNRI